jgi:hypothetical protein
MNERREQLKAGLVAFLVLMAIILILPASAGFADWYNYQNANKTSEATIFTETAATVFDMDGTSGATAGVRLSNYSKPSSYFYWYNTSSVSPLNKNNITAFAAGVFTVSNLSTARNPRIGTAGASNDMPNNNGWPYWEIYFNVRAWDAYYDDMVRIKLNLTSLKAGTVGSYGDWAQTVTLSWSDGTTDMDFWTMTLAQSDIKVSENIELDTNELRAAITEFGELSGWLKLTILKQNCGVTGPRLANSATYTYSAVNLVDRDAALGVGAMITGIFGIVGALVVQPNISLSDLLGRGNRGKGRGR